MRHFLTVKFFHFFLKAFKTKAMIHLTPAQKIDLGNSLQKSFANLSKLIISYEERDYSRKYALMILKGKNCVLLNSIQEFIEIEVWLLLTFFMCLLNELSFILSHIKGYRFLTKVIHQIHRK